MRAIVTGAAGFVGRRLCRSLVERGWRVTGVALDAPPPGDAGAVEWVQADLRRAADVGRLFAGEPPDVIYHLAGVTFVPGAQRDPGHTYEVNVVGAVRLLGEVRERRRAGAMDPVVLVVGSAEEYGRHEPDDLPLGEEAPLRPLTVYAASKVAQEVAALEAFRSEGVRVVATRSFNHSGPGQAPHFLIPALAGRVLALRAGGGAALPIGNTATVRDFLHVDDVVRAYQLLAERGAAGAVYNVSSGVGVTVGEVAARVLRQAGVAAALEPQPALARAVDVPALVGSNAKLRADTGWEPALSLDHIVDDVLTSLTHAPPH